MTDTGNRSHIAREYMRNLAMSVGPDWQAGRHQPRDPEAEIVTPTLDEMAVAPGATQTKYLVTYQKVGRHGGRDGSPPPAPLTVWAVTEEGLAEKIERDVAPYLLTDGPEVMINLTLMTGTIYSGISKSGTFTLEALQVAKATPSTEN